MSGGSSRGRYGNRMGVWNGPVNEHVTADLFVRAVFSETNAFHLQFAAVLESADLEVEPLVGEVLFLNRNLGVYRFFATALQALI